MTGVQAKYGTAIHHEAQMAEAQRIAELRDRYDEEVVNRQPVPQTLDMGDGWTIRTNGSRRHSDWQYFRNGNEWKYFNRSNKDLERDLNERADQMQWQGILESRTFGV